MNTYPSTLPNPTIQSSHKLSIAVIKTDVEGGYTQVRRRHSRKIESWTLKYDYLEYSDYAVLKEFFEENQALAFIWTHPLTLENHTVRFDGDDLDDTMDSIYTNVMVSIKEV